MNTTEVTDAVILKHARGIIADGTRWCQGSVALAADGSGTGALSPRAVSFCAAGVIYRARAELGLEPEYSSAFRALDACATAQGLTVTVVNDYKGHAAVLALFDEAIAHAERTT